MTTAAQLLKAALQELVVQDVEAPLEPSEYQDAIFYLNNFMFGLDAEGVALGFTEVANLGDEITVPPGAIQGIIKNLAVLLAPMFDVAVPQELFVQADVSMRTLEKLGVSNGSMAYPSTLPIGSGNEKNNFNSSHYYSGTGEDILLESSESIATEEGTSDAA